MSKRSKSCTFCLSSFSKRSQPQMWRGQLVCWRCKKDNERAFKNLEDPSGYHDRSAKTSSSADAAAPQSILDRKGLE